jgi:hypothetical protein
MTDRLTIESLAELTASHDAPCLSLFQPTHRSMPDNQQDPIRFRNLVKVLDKSLQQQYSATEIKKLLEPFEKLARDPLFWNYTQDGLAVFAAPGFFRVYLLQQSMPELAVAADSFHIKPLRRFLQSVDRYQVLALSRDKFRLFEGSRDTLDEIEIADDIPQTIQQALGDDLTDPRHSVSSYGGVGAMKGSMHHGHGGRKDALDVDDERFFRFVDRQVHEHFSKKSQLPLILASVTEHHHLFHKVSHNPFLMEDGLAANADGFTLDELRKRIWEIVEPQHLARQAALAEAFSEAKAHQLGDDNLRQVAVAAASGRVDTLMIEEGHHIEGRLDPETGKVETAELSHPEVDDVLDDLGELVEKMGGEVWILPPDQMPGKTGLAAIYRH